MKNKTIKSKMLGVVVGLAAASVVPGLVTAQTPKVNVAPQNNLQAEITAVEETSRAKHRAIQTGDEATYNRIVGLDYYVVDVDGVRRDKMFRSILRMLRRSSPNSPTFEPVNYRVIVSPDAQMAVSVCDLVRQNAQGQPLEQIYTETFVKRDGQWVLVMSHITNKTRPKRTAASQAAPVAPAPVAPAVPNK